MSFSSPPCMIQRKHQKDVPNTWELGLLEIIHKAKTSKDVYLGKPDITRGPNRLYKARAVSGTMQRTRKVCKYR